MIGPLAPVASPGTRKSQGCSDTVISPNVGDPPYSTEKKPPAGSLATCPADTTTFATNTPSDLRPPSVSVRSDALLTHGRSPMITLGYWPQNPTGVVPATVNVVCTGAGAATGVARGQRVGGGHRRRGGVAGQGVGRILQRLPDVAVLPPAPDGDGAAAAAIAGKRDVAAGVGKVARRRCATDGAAGRGRGRRLVGPVDGDVGDRGERAVGRGDAIDAVAHHAGCRKLKGRRDRRRLRRQRAIGRVVAKQLPGELPRRRRAGDAQGDRVRESRLARRCGGGAALFDAGERPFAGDAGQDEVEAGGVRDGDGRGTRVRRGHQRERTDEGGGEQQNQGDRGGAWRKSRAESGWSANRVRFNRSVIDDGGDGRRRK